MNKQTEALKMAIEALSQDEGWFEPEAAIQACKEALEQPAQEYLTRAQQVIRANNSAQEPVAKGFIRSLVSIDKNGIETWKEEPFYTSPPSWQGLSDDEIYTIRNANTQFYFGQNHTDELRFARAIEQALRERNCNDTK